MNEASQLFPSVWLAISNQSTASSACVNARTSDVKFFVVGTLIKDSHCSFFDRNHQVSGLNRHSQTHKIKIEFEAKPVSRSSERSETVGLRVSGSKS